MAPKSAKRRRTPSPSASATAKRTKFDLDIAATPPGQKRQNLEHQHDESEVDHPEGPAVSLFLQDNTDLPVQQQQAKPDSQHYNYVTRSDRNNSNKNMRAPSSLPHRIGFMDLPGELRSRIYEYVNEEMATTPDTPVNLSKYCRHPVNRNWMFIPLKEGQRVSFPFYELRERDEEEIRFSRYRKVLRDPNVCLRLTKHPHQRRQIRKARENLVSCQLNRVCHAIRNEFVPLLWQCMHFRYCSCCLALMLYRPIGVRGAPVVLLRRNIKHLTFDTHCINKVWTCEVVRLARVMIALEFKGSPRVIGVQYQIDIVYKGIMRASTAYRDGYATRQLVRLSTKLTIFSAVSMQVSTPSTDLLISVDLIENLTLGK